MLAMLRSSTNVVHCSGLRCEQPTPAKPSLHQGEKWLAFFDNIRGELRPVGAADVLRRMRCSGRDEEDVAGLDRRLLAADLVLERAFDNIDDLFARMCMHRR